MKGSSIHDLSPLAVWEEAIRQNIINIVRDLTPSDILDELYEQQCLTKDDMDTIKTRQTEDCKIRTLIVRIVNNSPEIVNKFINILAKKEAYQHLAKSIRETYEYVRVSKLQRECVICYIQSRVQLVDVADHLWQQKIIPFSMYTEIVNSSYLNDTSKSLWGKVLRLVNENKKREHARLVFERVVGNKYAHIKQYLKKLPKKQPLQCVCCKRRKLRLRRLVDILESCSEVSTTSSRRKNKKYTFNHSSKTSIRACLRTNRKRTG